MVYKWELDHLWDSIATSNMDGNMPSHVDFAPLSDWSIPQKEGSKSSKSKLPLWAKKRFKVDFPTLLQVNLHVKGKQFGVVTPGPYPGSCSHEFWGTVCWWKASRKVGSRKPSMIKDQWQSKIPGHLEEETVNPSKPSRLGVTNINIHRQAQETASCKIPSQLSAPSASNERSICGKISILEVDASQLLGCWKIKSREREGPKGFS